MDLVSCDFIEFVSVAFLFILFTDDVLHKAKALVFFCCLFFFFLVLFCLFVWGFFGHTVHFVEFSSPTRD